MQGSDLRETIQLDRYLKNNINKITGVPNHLAHSWSEKEVFYDKDNNGNPVTIIENIRKFREDAEHVWVSLVKIYMKLEVKYLGRLISKLGDPNTFEAWPEISKERDTDLIFRLTITDNKNTSSTDDVKVTIKHILPPNKAPSANAGVDQSVSPGDTVTLDGSGSTDLDGTIASYSWMQTAGPSVVLNDANTASASFTAPSISSDTQLQFSLTVKDNPLISAIF
jgi:hypothetical protein